ncbi:MAG TPA: DNA methyltransferase, partial [Deinococcales bacterium]|nr:DNA methyltransferase [Deinococcales bacterium]
EWRVAGVAQSLGLPAYPMIGPSQFYGLEVNPFAHHLASMVVWIGYLQWHLANRHTYRADPILERLDNIHLTDALLDGEAKRPWPEAEYIVGNPPFKGDKQLRDELGHAYVERLFRVYEGTVPHGSDYVCYWFERAREAIAAGQTRRAGLIATNSIRGGVNRRVLDRICEDGGIFAAWSDEPWTLDGAAVRVSIVGFDDGSDRSRTLNGQPVAAIAADLTAGVDLTIARRLPENGGISFVGDQKGGAFDVSGELARTWLDLPNPGGRSNRDVLKPWVNAKDIVQAPSGRWIIDFGAMPEAEARLYEAPFQHVLEKVKPERMTANREAYRLRWWIHGEARPGMQRALAKLRRFIVTPRHSKHRLFVWLEAPTVPDSAVIVFAREDDFTFGVLHSRVHELWALALGTSLEDRPRYTPSSTFETFPFPKPAPAEHRAVAAAAEALDRMRSDYLVRAGVTLTALYNQRQPWLAALHDDLDQAVNAAYGWPYPLEDQEILARLLALNLERAGERSE